MHRQEVGRIRVGCCGFARGMKEYFHQFRLVEIQQTFYKLPKLETALKWREQAPTDFEFTLKAWQLITHPSTSPTYRKAGVKISPGKEDHYGFFRATAEVYQAWDATMRFARALKAKIIVFKCPASFKPTIKNIYNLMQFFRSIKNSGLLFAWEPRGEWQHPTIKSLCSELGLIHCVDPMERKPLCSEPQYFRLHGMPHYRHNYTEDELKQLKEKIGDRETYVLFNNLNMYHDAFAFARLLKVE